MNKKLGPRLRSYLTTDRSSGKEFRSPPPEAEVPPGAVERVRILVEFSGDIADLTAIGFETHSFIEHPEEGYKIATGTIPVNQVEELATIEHLVRADLPKMFKPHLDYSLPEIRANVVHTGTPSRKGDGVVIGIIDTGIDWRHGSFIDFDDRTSRILAYWDQLKPSIAGETAGPNGTGVVYSQSDLSQGIRGTKDVRSLDEGYRLNQDDNGAGHGTHVAGIAAGSGAPASCCHGINTYVGVAPHAELIIVRSDFADDHLTQAIDFIFNHTSAAGKPIVINMSLGGNVGPHDGTDFVEHHIDAAVASSGRAVVVAAGNSGRTRGHAQGTVPHNGNVEIEFEVAEGQENNVYVDLWYDRAGTLNLEVIADGGATSGTVNHGNDHSFTANPSAAANRQSTVSIDGTINAAAGRDNNFLITIGKPQSGNAPHGDWKLKLTNPTATDVHFHCWTAPDYGAQFLEAVDPPDNKIRASASSTVEIPGTSAGAITVANHASRTSWCDCWPSTGIVASSSRGPVARGAATNLKPDIAAPGLDITSAKADAANLKGNCWSCCPDACCCLYTDLTGTSMAAPHVAGAIALMLEERPSLTKAEILQHLQASAREKPTGGRDDIFGAGKLDVQAAINAVRGAGGGGGGGGGGGPHPFMPTTDGDLIGLPTLLGSGRPSRRRSSSAAEFSTSSSEVRELPPAIRILRARMKAVPYGEYVVATVSRHFSEVRRLINTNRRVATMWHRSDGPRMLRRLVRGALDGEAPAAFLSDRQRDYFDRMFDLLARYGSRRLRESIERYRGLIFALLETPLALQVISETADSYA